MFTELFGKVLRLSHEEARMQSSFFVEPIHLMLGIVREGSGIASNILAKRGVDLRAVRLRVEKSRLVENPKSQETGKLPLSLAAEKTIERARRHADTAKHNYICTEHLLCAILEDKTCMSFKVLVDLGVQPQEVVEEIFVVCGFPKEYGEDVLGIYQSDFKMFNPEISHLSVVFK